MPRGPRLDAPEALHHVIVRGLERRVIFRDGRDRQAFLGRLEAVAKATELVVLAWALLPNHVHLLVRTSPHPTPAGRGTLGTAMRRLLTGYAGTFNRRHRRSGHVFQNRYKSILVEEEPYLLELVRYIHLNPLRAGIVRDLGSLDRYPWTGHSALLGNVARPWQEVDEVLGQFGRRAGPARQSYRQFVAEGVTHGRRPELQGGGLRRSAGGWEGVAGLRRGRERWATDERILGSGPFVETVRREATQAPPLWPRAQAVAAMRSLIERVAELWNLSPEEVAGPSRRRSAPAARSAVCTLAITRLGLPTAAVGRAVGFSTSAASRAAMRGRAILAGREVELKALLASLKKEFS